MDNTLRKSKHNLKSRYAATVTALLVACGVNSGNPKGTPPPKTTSSIYLQSLPGSSMSDFVLRVRGLQFVKGLSLSAPQAATNGEGVKEVLFPEIKPLNIMEYSQKGGVALVENYELEDENYSQVRILLDVTHAGTTNLISGKKKIVHVMPLDLFVAASDQPALEGGRQSDQIVFKDDAGIIKSGTDNNFAFFFDLGQLVASADSLNSPMKDFYAKEKKLTQDDINSSLFLKPLQMDKKNIYPADGMGFIQISATKIETGRICIFPGKDRDAFAADPSILDQSCKNAAFVLPIASGKAAGSLPQGDYVAVAFRESESKVTGGLTPFTVGDDPASLEIK